MDQLGVGGGGVSMAIFCATNVSQIHWMSESGRSKSGLQGVFQTCFMQTCCQTRSFNETGQASPKCPKTGLLNTRWYLGVQNLDGFGYQTLDADCKICQHLSKNFLFRQRDVISNHRNKKQISISFFVEFNKHRTVQK